MALRRDPSSTYIGQGDWTNKGVEEPGRSGRQLEGSHGLGSHLVADDFGRVDGLHRSEAAGEGCAKHEDEDNADGRGRLVAVVSVSSRTASDDTKACHHTSRGGHEHLPAADDIVQARTDNGGNPTDDGIDNVENQLCVSVLDADAVEHNRQVVGYNAKGHVRVLLLCRGAAFVTYLLPLNWPNQEKAMLSISL